MSIQLFGIGRLGRDAEVRYLPDGTAVANLSVVFNYGRKDASTGKTPSQWVDAALWGKRAESLAEYLVKGQAFALTLEDAHIEEFERSDKSVGSKLVARVLTIDFAGPPPEAAAPPPPARRSQAPAPAPRRAPVAKSSTGFDDMDDDIPF